MRYPNEFQAKTEEAIVRLSLEHPELGADKIGRLVRKEAIRVRNQRVRQVRRREGLAVPPPKKKIPRVGISTGELPKTASCRGHEAAARGQGIDGLLAG